MQTSDLNSVRISLIYVINAIFVKYDKRLSITWSDFETDKGLDSCLRYVYNFLRLRTRASEVKVAVKPPPPRPNKRVRPRAVRRVRKHRQDMADTRKRLKLEERDSKAIDEAMSIYRPPHVREFVVRKAGEPCPLCGRKVYRPFSRTLSHAPIVALGIENLYYNLWVDSHSGVYDRQGLKDKYPSASVHQMEFAQQFWENCHPFRCGPEIWDSCPYERAQPSTGRRKLTDLAALGD